ncbi:MAG: M56 family metallopeptidase [Bacteroidota bacterium]
MEFQTAIYTTLLHSLWMGLILAVATSIIVIATKKSTASIRYNLLTGALCLFVVAIGFVFYLEMGNTEAQSSSGHLAGLNHITTETITGPNQNQAALTSTQQLLSNVKGMVAFWSSYSNQIVLIWFLIICAKCVQLLAGLHAVNYLKTNKVFNAGAYWENKVAELSNRLGIARKVEILQSGMAKVPMIAGHFKPVILVPIGMLNGLSLKEVEAILSHELAHLKRNDYLVNLLQSFVEIIFFFNPAVLWISKLIKEERENCCDDLALSCTDNKHQYIRALISCQEFQASQPAYAMAITGRKNSLKERVSRMVFNSNSSLNRVEKTLLTVVLISAVILTAAFTKVTTPASSSLTPASSLTPSSRTGSLRGTKQSSTTITPASPLTPSLITPSTPSSSLTTLSYITTSSLQNPDLLKCPPGTTLQQDTTKKKTNQPNKNSTLQKTTNQNANQAAAAADKKAAEIQKNVAVQVANEINISKNLNVANDVKVEQDMAKQAGRDAKYNSEAKKYREDFRKRAIEMKKYQTDMAKFKKDIAKYSADMDKYIADVDKHAQDPKNYPLPAVPTVPAQPAIPAIPASPGVAAVPAVPAVPAHPGKPATITRITVPKTPNAPNQAAAPAAPAAPKPDMTNDLKRDGLLQANAKNFKYQLNAEKLVINGVTQPAQIHQKYVNKYLKNKKGTITTSVSTD